MWGPGSRDLLGHCDSQTEVRPRLGTGSRTGKGAGAAGADSPALSRLADHTRAWAEMLLRPPRAPRKDGSVRPESRPLRGRVTHPVERPREME